MNKKLLIPGYYLFYSRLKRKSELFSLLVVYPFFLGFIIIISKAVELLPFICAFLMGLFTWLSFYEIGYLENDTVTIQKEKKPTLRLPKIEISQIRSTFLKIVVLKLIIGCFGLLGLFFINKLHIMPLFMGYFILGIGVSRIAFFLHNTLRNQWNIVTYHVLSTTKYLSLIALFLSVVEYRFIYLLVWLLFPVPRTLEHAVKIKYSFIKLQRIIGNLDTFRVKYYTLCLLVSLCCYFFMDNEESLIALLAVGWFFIFRVGIFIILRIGAYKRTNFTSHDWE